MSIPILGSQDEYYCQHCGNGSVEFEIHTIIKTDSGGTPVNLRPRREIFCCQCNRSGTVVVVKKDAITAELEKQAMEGNPVAPETTNRVVVRDAEAEEKARKQPINLTRLLGDAQDGKLKINIRGL